MLDKHSAGGVGDTVSFVLAQFWLHVAALCPVPVADWLTRAGQLINLSPSQGYRPGRVDVSPSGRAVRIAIAGSR